MSDWCILRTASSQTLRLAETLAEAGFEVWTPLGPMEVRKGPCRTRREVETPLAPTYVFARADRLQDLLDLSRDPAPNYLRWDRDKGRHVAQGHPFFSVFRSGAHRLIPDAELSALRRAERRPRPKTPEHVFRIGEKVRPNDAGFTGLVGTVVAVDRQLVTVQFPRWDIAPQFGAWLLQPVLDENPEVHVSNGLSEQALPAKAA